MGVISPDSTRNGKPGDRRLRERTQPDTGLLRDVLAARALGARGVGRITDQRAEVGLFAVGGDRAGLLRAARALGALVVTDARRCAEAAFDQLDMENLARRLALGGIVGVGRTTRGRVAGRARIASRIPSRISITAT